MAKRRIKVWVRRGERFEPAVLTLRKYKEYLTGFGYRGENSLRDRAGVPKYLKVRKVLL